MSAFVLPLFTIVNGPAAHQLWNAAQHQHSLYFSVRAAGLHVHPSQEGVMRRRGVPLALAAEYGQPNNLGIRFYDYEFGATFTGQYSIDSATNAKTGTLSCDAAQARIEWLGVDPGIVEMLAGQKIYTVNDALFYSELEVAHLLLGDLMGYDLNNHFVQAAVRRFTQLRDRLCELNPQLQFKGGPQDVISLFQAF